MTVLTLQSAPATQAREDGARIIRKEGHGGEKLKACGTAPSDALILI